VKRLTPTTAPPISRVQIARYASAVGDFNPMHVDEEFAKASGMPSVIAHGPLTAAIVLDAVVGQVGLDVLSAADVRFKTPVFPGDQLSVVPVEGGVEVLKADGSVAATVSLRSVKA
jgi:acyl dehydratase